MAFELGVTEVGPAEYPLIEVLRDTIFGEVGHVSRSTIAEDLEGRQDVLALIAHLEGNPVGFKVGYRAAPGVYYSKAGGVLKEYRRNGLAKRMRDWQQNFARARGYRQIYFNTFNHFPEMIVFGLEGGYEPVAAEWRPTDKAMSFKFTKSLEDNGHTPAPASDLPRLDQSSLEIDSRDRDSLAMAVRGGYRLVGIRHDAKLSLARVLLERA